jgi:hypothetical protein
VLSSILNIPSPQEFSYTDGVLQLKSGRIMIDCSSFHRYTGDDEKLAPLNDPSSTARGPQICGSQGEAKTVSDDIDYQGMSSGVE